MVNCPIDNNELKKRGFSYWCELCQTQYPVTSNYEELKVYALDRVNRAYKAKKELDERIASLENVLNLARKNKLID